MTPLKRMQKFLPWLLAALVLLTALFAWHLQKSQHTRDTDRFNALLGEISPRFFYHVNLAQALAGQVQKYAQMGGSNWTDFQPETEWLQRFPYCQGYGYAQRQGDALRVVHETFREGQGTPGRNLMENKEIRDAWEEAMRNGKSAATQPFPSPGDGSEKVILMVRPVFAGNRAPAGEEARRAEVKGAAYSYADPDLLFDVAMKSTDRDLMAVERLAWEAPVEKSDFVRTLSVSINGFGWKFRVTPGPDFYSVSDHRTPYLILGGGLFLATGILGLTRLQERRRLELESLNRSLDQRVASLTESLAKENEQLRAAEAESARLLARERELGELKGRVVSTVSHEFRTPLSVILSSSEILRVYHDKLDDTQRHDYLVSIEDSVTRMNSLIQGVLAFGKAGAGRLGFAPEKRPPLHLLQEIVGESLSATSRRCPITLQCSGLEEEAWLDPTLLRLILGNLLGNAVKYSAEGSPVELEARREGDRLILRVSDHGMGIPERDLPVLFEAFHRGHNTHGIPGTGLGLSIVKHLAQAFGGSVGLDSRLREGSTFRVSLPRVK